MTRRYKINFNSTDMADGLSLDVPDLATALIVADINLARGSARILSGDTLVARVEKRGFGQAPYWVVDRLDA